MKKCKKGHYYCYQDSKCKPIPKGYRIGVGGYLRRGRDEDQEESKKNGNGNGNGNSKSNGNNGNGSGNGNGGSGGNAGGNGSGGGVGESVEIQNSDGDVTALVTDIIGPDHMRPRLNGKGVWTGTHITEVKFGGYIGGITINPNKMRDAYGNPPLVPEPPKIKEVPLTPSQNRLLVMGKKKNVTGDYIKGTQKNLDDGIDKNIHGVGKGKKIKKTLGGPDINLAHYEPDGELIEYTAVISKGADIFSKASKYAPHIMTGLGAFGTFLQSRRAKKARKPYEKRNETSSKESKEDMLQRVRDSQERIENEVKNKEEILNTPTDLNKFSGKKISPDIKKKIDKPENQFNSFDPLIERKMTESEKRKDDRLKKKYNKSDMKKSMQKQYGKEEGKKVYFATIRKQAMEEEKKKDHEPEMIRNQLKTAKRASKRIKSHTLKKDNFKAWVQSKITKASDYLDTAADYLDSKDDVKEEKKKVVMSPVMLAMLKLADAKKRNKNALLNLKYVGEESNPRIPRKKGQPANSKKHSDLYTDENPKGTIHGLGFKDVATAKASVAKIRKSNRSHAHKIQAAVAMEQRAREMGKTSEAAVYRKFINSMKKKTKD